VIYRGCGDINTFPSKRLLLTIQRHMILKFADQDLGNKRCTSHALPNADCSGPAMAKLRALVNALGSSAILGTDNLLNMKT